MQIRLVSFLMVFAVSPIQADSLLDEGYRHLYNLHFSQARESFTEYERQRPSDPLGPVSDAVAYLFSEFHRLRILQSEFFISDTPFLNSQKPSTDPDIKQLFEADLNRAKSLAETRLQTSPQDAVALFASVLRLGLHADYLALLEKRNLMVLAEIKKGRQQAEQLLAYQQQYYDAYLAIGVENYLLSLKPISVRWFLQLNGAKTNKQAGIDNLRLTADHGHCLLPYARLLLAVSALRDGDNQKHNNSCPAWPVSFPTICFTARNWQS